MRYNVRVHNQTSSQTMTTLNQLTKHQIELLYQSTSRDEFYSRFGDMFYNVMKRAIVESGHHNQQAVLEAFELRCDNDHLESMAQDLWDDLICGDLPENILQDIEKTAYNERQAGGYCKVDNMLDTVAVTCSDGSEYFLQGEDGQNLLDRCPQNVDAEDWILWQAIGW